MRKIIFSMCAFLGFFSSLAQGVKIGEVQGAPDQSAILELETGSRGFLPPRMTTAERNAIVNPASGLQIYNTTTECLNIRIGSTWKQVCGDCDFNSPVAGNSGPICEGSTLNLSATSIIGATYQWSGPNGFASSLQNPSISNATPAATGTYSVSATLNGCTSQLQNTVATVNPTPVTPAAGNDSPVCVGSQLNLTAITVNGASYSWTGPNGYSANVQNPVLNSVQITNGGVYNVSTVVNGCTSASGTTNVIINATPATPGIITGPSAVCPNSAGNIYSIASVSGATSYSWTMPSETSITNNSGTSVTVAYGGTTSGSVLVAATNICGTSAENLLSISASSICSPYVFYANGSGRLGSIQSFTVPSGVTSLTIDVRGAQGGTGNSAQGGKGARIVGTVTVTPGDELKILVGQVGSSSYVYTGGGGGSFVATSANVPLVVAGGGGGGNGGTNITGSDGSASENGLASSDGVSGGTSGNGGNGASGGGGGGGFYTDGNSGYNCNYFPGLAFVNGGAGAATQQSIYGGEGGFGGGASGDGYCCGMGGAGGGYSGGGGGKNSCGQGIGGGGGSFNSGTNQTNTSGYQTGNGQVTFTW